MAALLALAPLILQFGIPAVEQLIKMFQQPTGPTQADWDNLKALTKISARQQMLQTLAEQGVDPTSPQGVALLALTPA